MNKPLLILDLDETLIYSIPTEEYQNEKYDFLIGEDFYVKKRPYVEDFLLEISEHFDLAVWTAASHGYGQNIVKELFVKNNLTLEFFHSRSNCVSKEYLRIGDDYYPEQHFIKDLSKIKKKYNLDRVLMADDLKVSLQRNYGNLVHVTPFRGDIEDTHLLSLKEYLISIKQEENLRKIEKRYWKDNYNQKTLEHNYKKPKM